MYLSISVCKRNCLPGIEPGTLSVHDSHDITTLLGHLTSGVGLVQAHVHAIHGICVCAVHYKTKACAAPRLKGKLKMSNAGIAPGTLSV